MPSQRRRSESGKQKRDSAEFGWIETEVPDAESKRQLWVRLTVCGLVALVAALGYRHIGDALTLESLAWHESSLRQFQATHPVLVYGLAFLIYVVVTGLSLPGALVLTLVYGWYFGLLRGVILVSFASTAGATVAFLFSRYLLRDLIQIRLGDRLAVFNRALEREGAFYLFTLRLIAAVPFFVINLVMGLTPLSVATYWWVSQLGMLPATIVYVYTGSTVPDLNTLARQGVGGTPLQLVVTFAVLGLFPLAVKRVMQRIRPAAAPEHIGSPSRTSFHGMDNKPESQLLLCKRDTDTATDAGP